ncbi:MAG: thiamine pyrophosphate-dependent enzyme [Nitrospinaceae bacterium]|jgi:pyruvate ferredoxin oxidoreductase beta subunit|nr:thiamine pyrophosphate-dependent enzyme [Nitrospinaceae bacterium]MDP7147605.1 thiamine pyrophosphate-dependent enzyme [Nitrospinaceae bacterium]MDP7611523.1 thiamine pyrophosphate-dependent enzyme [Nitrospinaceae bacterium]|tara:strand:- start:1238 stop:2098 length:861 start_codon:yes stop_codon:yes gene_type:complete
MSLDTVKPSPGFLEHLPIEYRDLVEHGPYGQQKKVTDLGKFKELGEEHPMCAGCAMSLFIRLVFLGLPKPEHTVIVGTAGCGRLAISQGNVPFVYGNYGDTNAVATGIKRGLELRFPEQDKDVVVMCGDGGLVDIGFQGLMHSWFRHEKFTTILLDNEVYGNTGGQESGMTQKGQIMKMSPRGKKDDKMDMLGLAKVAKLDYVARITPTNPSRVVRTVKRAIHVAREFGSTYVQAYTSCNIEYSIPTPDVMQDAFDMEKERYGFEEIISDRAKAYLDEIEKKKKKK